MKQKVVLLRFWKIDGAHSGRTTASLSNHEKGFSKRTVATARNVLGQLSTVATVEEYAYDIVAIAQEGVDYELFKLEVLGIADKCYNIDTVMDEVDSIDTAQKQRVDLGFQIDPNTSTLCAVIFPKKTDRFTTLSMLLLHRIDSETDLVVETPYGKFKHAVVRPAPGTNEDAFRTEVMYRARLYFKVESVEDLD